MNYGGGYGGVRKSVVPKTKESKKKAVKSKKVLLVDLPLFRNKSQKIIASQRKYLAGISQGMGSHLPLVE